MRFLFFSLALCVTSALCGQKLTKHTTTATTTVREAVVEQAYSWPLFVEEYLQSLSDVSQETTDDDVLDERYAALEELEEIHRHPIAVNSASREELLRVGFLSDEQVDEILAVRDRYRGGFASLGELLTIRSLSYRDRAWLSLLLNFSPAPSDSLARERTLASQKADGQQISTGRHRALQTAENRWRNGSHEILGNLSVPLQRQAGFHDYDADNYRTKMFTGYPVAHSLKYRYNWRHRLRYGATVEEDVGERWSAYGGKPWDFNSLHFFYQTDPIKTRHNQFSRCELSLGDYRISLGQGLAVGSSSWGQFSSLLTGFRQESTHISPHTGNAESGFLRGAATHIRLGAEGQWDLTAFASWCQKDGTVKGATASNDFASNATDTITAWKTDGLHRTLQEISKRHVADQWVGGGRFGYRNHWLNVGLDAVALHYNKVYWPASRAYNKYYMRGRNARTVGGDYAINLGQWSLQGELQLNTNGTYASTSALRWQPKRSWQLVLQHRSFAKDFVSPLGNTLQAGSQIQNEEGTLLGFRYNGPRRLVLMGYADYTRHRHPVYLADTTSHRIEAMLQCNLRTGASWSHTLQYKVKSREQNVRGYKDVADLKGVLMSWRTTQHLRWQSTVQSSRWATTLGADGALYYSQGSAYDKQSATITSVRSLGGLVYGRTTYAYRQRLKLSLMGAAFMTDDYNARCFAYVPQLRGRSISFPTFSGQGLTGHLLMDVVLWQGFSAGMSFGVTKYFDRDTIGSGINLISASVKTDLQLQLRWVI